MNILSDMFFNSLFDEKEIEREKKVVLEEINMYEDTPDDIVHDLLAQASYGDHPLAYPILGTADHVNSFTHETLKTYMNAHYTPENVVISIAGHINEGLEEATENHFGHYTSASSIDEVHAPSFTPKHLIRKKETEQAHLCMGFNGVAVTDEDLYPLMLVNSVLGGSMSSRLFQEIREKHGLAYSVFSYHSSFLDNGLLTVYAGTGTQQLSLLKESIDQTIDQITEKGISTQELKNSKEQLKANLLFSLESPNSKMARNGKNELLLNKQNSVEDIIKEIEMVNNTAIQSIIHRIFNQEPSVSIVTSKE